MPAGREEGCLRCGQATIEADIVAIATSAPETGRDFFFVSAPPFIKIIFL
jgi:hypothetical protein